MSRVLGSSTQTPTPRKRNALGACARYTTPDMCADLVTGCACPRPSPSRRPRVRVPPTSMTMCALVQPVNVKRLRSAWGLSYNTHRVDLNPATRGEPCCAQPGALKLPASAEHTQTTPQDTSVPGSHTGPLKTEDTSHTCRVHRRYSSERYGHGRSCASPPLQLCHNGRRQVQLWRHVRPCRP